MAPEAPQVQQLSQMAPEALQVQPLSQMHRNAASHMKTKVESIPEEVKVMQAYNKHIFDSGQYPT